MERLKNDEEPAAACDEMRVGLYRTRRRRCLRGGRGRLCRVEVHRIAPPPTRTACAARPRSRSAPAGIELMAGPRSLKSGLNPPERFANLKSHFRAARLLFPNAGGGRATFWQAPARGLASSRDGGRKLGIVVKSLAFCRVQVGKRISFKRAEDRTAHLKEPYQGGTP